MASLERAMAFLREMFSEMNSSIVLIITNKYEIIIEGK